jgi:glycerophosphoryl diester phosphodiesterase
VEFDVWLSRDGQVVVHHDDNFKRMTDHLSDTKIYEMDYSEMPSIAAEVTGGSPYTVDECCKIPLLEHVLSAIPPQVTIVIEFKQDSDALIQAVLRLVSLFDRRSSMFWFSLDERLNSALRAADSSIPTITSVPGMLRVLALYYSGLLPFSTIPDAVFGITVEEVSCLSVCRYSESHDGCLSQSLFHMNVMFEQITLEDIRNEQSLSFLPSWVHPLLHVLFRGKPPHLMIAPSLFRQLRLRGIPVWFLGVNTEQELQLAMASGATAVLTDRVRWLLREMKDLDIRFEEVSWGQEESEQ